MSVYTNKIDAIALSVMYANDRIGHFKNHPKMLRIEKELLGRKYGSNVYYTEHLKKVMLQQWVMSYCAFKLNALWMGGILQSREAAKAVIDCSEIAEQSEFIDEIYNDFEIWAKTQTLDTC